MMDAMADWTPEEVASLPQTDTIFEPRQLDFDSHQWQQQGYMISDICNPGSADCAVVGIPIGSGKMLIKQEGGYKLVSELDKQFRARK